MKNGKQVVGIKGEQSPDAAAKEQAAHKVSDETLAGLRLLNDSLLQAKEALHVATVQRFGAEANENQAAGAWQQAQAAYVNRVTEAAKLLGLDVETTSWNFDLTSATFKEHKR